MRFSLAAGFFLLLAAAPALAAETGPSIKPVFKPDGSFSFCMGEQEYPEDRKLTLALSPEKKINVGVRLRGGGFKKGASYDVAFSLDDEESRLVRAVALNGDTVLLQMGGNAPFQKKLGKAKKLSLGAGSKIFSFPLPPMDKYMRTLEKCVAENAGRRMEKGASKQTEDSSLEEFPDSLKKLLSATGIGPFEPLSMKEVPLTQRPADFLWQTGKILGGLRERQAPADKGLSDLVGLHLHGLEKKCQGRFKSDIGREQVTSSLRLRTAEATCRPKEGTEDDFIIVGLVFYLSAERVFTVFTFEGAGENRAEVLSARDKLASTVLEMTGR